MDIYSDILLEAAGFAPRGGCEKKIGNIRHYYSEVTRGDSEKAGRKAGLYDTFESVGSADRGTASMLVERVIGKYLASLGLSGGKALIVGFGNATYTCDALGGAVVSRLHIGQGKKWRIGAVAPLVNSITGIESVDIVKGIIAVFEPNIVIAVDTLVTSSTERLCNCIQLTTAGIEPGGGVGNSRGVLDRAFAGIPVIGVGVPMVIPIRAASGSAAGCGYFTLQDVDAQVETFGKILSSGINGALM